MSTRSAAAARLSWFAECSDNPIAEDDPSLSDGVQCREFMSRWPGSAWTKATARSADGTATADAAEAAAGNTKATANVAWQRFAIRCKRLWKRKWYVSHNKGSFPTKLRRRSGAMHLECQTGMRYTPVPCGEGACRRRRRPDPTCQKSDVFPVCTQSSKELKAKSPQLLGT